MVTLTVSQKSIRDNLENAITHGIASSDDIGDIVVLAVTANAFAQRIFKLYVEKYGQDELDKLIGQNQNN